MKTTFFSSLLLFTFLLGSSKNDQKPDQEKSLVFSEIMNSNIVGEYKKWQSEDGNIYDVAQLLDAISIKNYDYSGE